jgi:hypothetical protein
MSIGKMQVPPEFKDNKRGFTKKGKSASKFDVVFKDHRDDEVPISSHGAPEDQLPRACASEEQNDVMEKAPQMSKDFDDADWIVIRTQEVNCTHKETRSKLSFPPFLN